MEYKLTNKQQKFADEYIRTGNATKSALEAGYSPKTAQRMGSENLSKPLIKSYINSVMEKLESAKIATAKETLEYLSSVMRGEQTEDVVTNKGVFQDIPVSAKDRITAAKEILKRYPSDPISKAQLRKLNADADVSEAKAKQLKEGTSLDGVTIQFVRSDREEEKDSENDQS
ncbi:terminase small subunit [Lactobacillus crispatus]|uniref:terminase small subunit n=1 Tax=Lactobacillus crispatus TaxID=47770 RepID=UPI001C4DF4B7|nr:terminase small subunit [Lactobacillus crispatus]MBW0437987.1 terminase small subunit [Lactobacillus crispatus]MBW0444538.1 terminase small subunit [Lactobacillus crispatus]MBW0456209.1 terminase small subunit [Lactobacillus crispatus]